MTGETGTDGLLVALRTVTGADGLRWSSPPVRLDGGFWADLYTVELSGGPPRLTGRFVARIMPDADVAAYETAVQRHLHRHGVQVPAVQAAGAPTGAFPRAWMLMEYIGGGSLLEDLDGLSALRAAPTLLRRVPDLLAAASARLHRCPPGIFGVAEFADGRDRADLGAWLDRLAGQAEAVERRDLAALARAAAADIEPGSGVVCHGDLHPFNVLLDGPQWYLVDWSTALVADPHFDLAFTTMILQDPPLDGPAPVRAVARRLGRRMARRFLQQYEAVSGTAVDARRLGWGRRVHTVRILVELATWDHDGDRPQHPWRSMRRRLEDELAARRR